MKATSSMEATLACENNLKNEPPMLAEHYLKRKINHYGILPRFQVELVRK